MFKCTNQITVTQTVSVKTLSAGFQTDDSGIESAVDHSDSECQTTNLRTENEKCQTDNGNFLVNSNWK